MTPERWQQLYRIFDEAMELPAPERRGYLDQACAGDAELCAEIESLIAASTGADDRFPEAVAQAAAEYVAHAAPLAGKKFGLYQILRQVGSGGMGEVYLAVDSRLGRQVALKMLPAEFTSDPYRLR